MPSAGYGRRDGPAPSRRTPCRVTLGRGADTQRGPVAEAFPDAGARHAPVALIAGSGDASPDRATARSSTHRQLSDFIIAPTEVRRSVQDVSAPVQQQVVAGTSRRMIHRPNATAQRGWRANRTVNMRRSVNFRTSAIRVQSWLLRLDVRPGALEVGLPGDRHDLRHDGALHVPGRRVQWVERSRARWAGAPLSTLASPPAR